jgi:hypothetical protein
MVIDVAGLAKISSTSNECVFAFLDATVHDRHWRSPARLGAPVRER